MTPGVCRVRYQSITIIVFARETTTRHIMAMYVQTIKVLTILPLSPANRKEVLLVQNLTDDSITNEKIYTITISSMSSYIDYYSISPAPYHHIIGHATEKTYVYLLLCGYP